MKSTFLVISTLIFMACSSLPSNSSRVPANKSEIYIGMKISPLNDIVLRKDAKTDGLFTNDYSNSSNQFCQIRRYATPHADKIKLLKDEELSLIAVMAGNNRGVVCDDTLNAMVGLEKCKPNPEQDKIVGTNITFYSFMFAKQNGGNVDISCGRLNKEDLLSQMFKAN